PLIVYEPALFVTTDFSTLALSITVTLAPTIAPPNSSSTCPRKEPARCCATTSPARLAQRVIAKTNFFIPNGSFERLKVRNHCWMRSVPQRGSVGSIHIEPECVTSTRRYRVAVLTSSKPALAKRRIVSKVAVKNLSTDCKVLSVR